MKVVKVSALIPDASKGGRYIENEHCQAIVGPTIRTKKFVVDAFPLIIYDTHAEANAAIRKNEVRNRLRDMLKSCSKSTVTRDDLLDDLMSNLRNIANLVTSKHYAYLFPKEKIEKTDKTVDQEKTLRETTQLTVEA